MIKLRLSAVRRLKTKNCAVGKGVHRLQSSIQISQPFVPQLHTPQQSYTNLIKVDSEANLCQLIFITLARSFLMESISFFERCLRGGERNQTYPYMLSFKQRSIYYHFITSLVWRGRGSNPQPASHRTKVLPLSNHCVGPGVKVRAAKEWTRTQEKF